MAGVAVIFTEMSLDIEVLLCAHDVIKPEDIVIPRLDDALEWCEEQVLMTLR